MLQHNYEIFPLDNFDYTILKYTYSSPISELSTLKFFNLMNTDCSIFFNETNKPSVPPSTISNNTAMLPFGSTDTLPVNNSIKVANNSPPLYDSRYESELFSPGKWFFFEKFKISHFVFEYLEFDSIKGEYFLISVRKFCSMYT